MGAIVYNEGVRDERAWPLAALLAVAAYGGAYAAMLKPHELACYSRGVPVGTLRLVGYRFGGAAAKRVFAPAHWVDRKLRQRHWGPPGVAMDSVFEED